MRLKKKDLDARWVKKNDINYYGYKNSICIDAEHGFSDALSLPLQISMMIMYRQIRHILASVLNIYLA